MDKLDSFKIEYDDFTVEYDIMPPLDLSGKRDEWNQELFEKLKNIDAQFEECQRRIDEINVDVDRLINHADGIDYMVAVGSGIIAGAIDILFVGEFSIEGAKNWGGEKINDFVIRIAKTQGYDKNDLGGAVQFLEKKFPIAADKVFNKFGGGKQHHLRDFSHHPTIVGLFFSLLTQFTEKVYGTDVTGVFLMVDLESNGLVGKNFPEKVVFGIVNWFFHMVSDMAGSTSSIHAGKSGTGLPGPILSFLKEVSALPIFRNMNEKGYKEISVWISKLFNGTLLGKRDTDGKLIEPIQFDLRTELGIVHEIGKQALPVIINECVVRGFYFIRRFITELKTNNIKKVNDLEMINWGNTVPFRNRTIVRMLTISTGTLEAIDLADAAIESAIKSGGTLPAFAGNMILRVNFVGIGRFAIAIGTDIGMGGNKNKMRNERMREYAKQMALINAKVFYKEADMWKSAENTEKTIEQVYRLIEKSTNYYFESVEDMLNNLDNISGYIPQIKQKNRKLVDEINDILIWG